jgi:hypothetical protein
VKIAWLYDNQDDPDWSERDASTARSDTKLREMRDELTEWADADPGEFLELLAACEERRVFGEDQ